MPTLPNLNDVNVNNWFQTIETNPAAWNAFATDLETDFLNALQIRFYVNPDQINFISQMMQSQKGLITCTIRNIANYLNQDTYGGKIVHATTQGLHEAPTGNKIDISIEAGVNKDFGPSGSSSGYVSVKVSSSL